MDFSDNTSVQSRTITALFDTRDAASKAVDDLVAAGIPRQHISLTEGSTTSGSAATDVEHEGFWQTLKDMFMPDEDRYSYAEGLRRGGFLVSVRSEEATYDRVLEILDRDGSVNLDERESAWRSEGWTGYRQGAVGTGAEATRLETAADIASRRSETRTTAQSTSASTLASATAGAGLAAAGTATKSVAADREEVVPIYEEQIRVGKRDVNQGRVRVRSYVVETPVNEQVQLRSESVQVERRPVDRAVTAGDAVFQDRVIEAEQYAEEAVVSKEARIKEEIALRKVTDSATQTVSDTVRHTEVKVEDERGQTLGANKTLASDTARFSAVDSTRITEHMEVISADGQTIGTVDHLDGPDRIKLAKNTSPDGQHHYVPIAWIDHVDQHVHLKKTLAEIKAGR